MSPHMTAKETSMTEQHALNWHNAELAANQRALRECDLWTELTEARRQEIRDRVKLVLDGEVRRSDMGPGDLAVWFGRTRLIHSERPEQLQKFLAEERERWDKDHPGKTPRFGPETSRMHFWDCMTFGPTSAPSTRIFGVGNIGYWHLTNLQVPGMLASDAAAYVRAWYLSLDADPELIRPLEEMLCESVMTFNIGDHPLRQDRGIDLWREPQPVDMLIPVRQNMGVGLEFFGNAFKTFRELVASRGADPERDPFRIWVHLEGWQLRYAQ